MTARKGLALAAWLLLSAAAPRTVTAQTVDDIVARHIAARGGHDKLKAIQTIKMTHAVATGIGPTLRVIVYKRPSSMRLEQGPVATDPR